jgi:hypothetical protein
VPSVKLNGFISHSHHLAGQQFTREFLVSSQMQIGEQDLARFHISELRVDRLLNFYYHLGLGPDLGGGFQYGGASLLKYLIAETGASPGI